MADQREIDFLHQAIERTVERIDKGIGPTLDALIARVDKLERKLIEKEKKK